MPREVVKDEAGKEEIVKSRSRTDANVTKKKDLSSAKSTATKNSKNDIKKAPSKSTKKVTSNQSKKAPSKSTSKVAKKVTKIASKSTSTSKKVVSKTSSNKAKESKVEIGSTSKTMLAEYYDLPYRYNQTIVKILAQTPTTLFVYWDISDDDRNALINMHGENFFYDTRPVLIVHNTTKNYSFEININDFANSWYIRTQEPNCDYVIELGRRFNKFDGEYVYINSSNDIVSPNDHILFEKTNLGNVLFKNVKTNMLSSKDFGDLRYINNIDKLYGNIYDVYNALYNDEILNELTGPSSGEFYLKR